MFKNFIFILLFNLLFSNAYKLQELKDLFGSDVCIQGSISTIQLTKNVDLHLKEAEDNFKSSIPNTTVLQTKKEGDKSVLSKISELAQYNEIKYFFKLEKEEGPPHEKLFTISLTLGNEKYVSEGRSLKKAQQNTATLALENTKYVHPPVKDDDENSASLTPTVLLNNLSTKLGYVVNYILVDEEKQGMLRSNVVLDEKTKSYIQKLNDSAYDSKSLKQRKDISLTKGPFRIKVEVGKYVFYGVAHSIQSAKHEAASSALDYLIQNKDNLESDCLGDEVSLQCQRTKVSLKSPISLIYEAGQLRNMDVDFEVIEETGPAHKKTFITQCKIGELTTTGEGKSKKESKKAAAENMLTRLPELPAVSQEMQVKNMIKSKNGKKKRKKKNKVIKTKYEEIGMVVEDFVGSVFGFGKNDDEIDTDTNTDLNSPKKPKHLKKSYQDELLETSSFLNIEINYTDFEEEDKFYSLLSLGIHPEHLCFGQSSDKNGAREKAADGALYLLFKTGLYDHFDEKYQSHKIDTKEAVRNILIQDVSEES